MSGNTVLCVAVHPDDETLGCGGTLLRHSAGGDQIHWLICTNVAQSHKLYEKRKYQIENVREAYAFEGLHRLEFEAMRMDSYSTQEVVGAIAEVIYKVRPNIVYLPFKSDVHSDHRVIFDAAFSCTKSFRYGFVEQLFMMETLSETEFAVPLPSEVFIPNVFVDITPFLQKKCEIMSIYDEEIGEHPFPRSIKNIEALAIYRGATAGLVHAESFMLLKQVVR